MSSDKGTSPLSTKSSKVKICHNYQHGSQIVRAVLCSKNEIHAAIFVKLSCVHFAHACNEDGITALHIAAAKGWNKMCRWLLRHGADIDARDQVTGFTPLHFAAMYGCVETMMLLAKAGGSYRSLSDSKKDAMSLLYENYRIFGKDRLHSASYVYDLYFTHFTSLAKLKLGKLQLLCDEQGKDKRAVFSVQMNCANPSNVEPYLISEGDSSDDCHSTDEEDIPAAAVFDFPPTKERPMDDVSSLYVFGQNQNYNLGLGTTRVVSRPTQLERFTRDQAVCEVRFSRYHTLYLTAAGTVRASGHGVGGRLGTGTEATCMRPEVVALPSGTKVIMVAAATDHSLFLTSTGHVYGCGLNTYHQLGVDTKIASKCVTPKMIAWDPASAKPAPSGSKYQGVQGVACARYHSVLWTTCELYTWGTNVGQLGHLDHVVPTPRLVKSCSSLNKTSGIYKVCVSNVCTVVAMLEGFLIVFYGNKYSIISSRLSRGVEAILSISCMGGVLSNVAKNPMFAAHNHTSHIKPGMDEQLVISESSEIINGLLPEKLSSKSLLSQVECNEDDLVIFYLTAGNLGYLWSAQRQSSRPMCLERYKIVDIFATPSALLAISHTGELLRMKVYANQERNSNLTVTWCVLAHLHRTKRIFADPNGQNFAVLCQDAFPKLFLDDEWCQSLVNDMTSLHTTLSLEESFCDVILECDGEKFPVHKMVLAAKSLFFRKLFSPSSANQEELSVPENGHHVQGRCDCGLSRGFYHHINEETKESTACYSTEDDTFNFSSFGKNAPDASFKQEPSPTGESFTPDGEVPSVDLTSLVTKDALRELISFFYTGKCKRVSYHDICSNAGNSERHLIETSKHKKKRNTIRYTWIYEDEESIEKHEKFSSTKELQQYVALLLKATKELEVEDFPADCKEECDLKLYLTVDVSPDVQFTAEDGSLGPRAHRFILSARVPFFSALFSARWALNACTADGLQLVQSPHCHSTAFLLLLQYCYTDHFCYCCLTLPLVMDLLVLTDELLAKDAQELAEKRAVDYIDRRNLLLLYQFSTRYNFTILKQHVLFFAYFETPFLLESRFFENLRPKDLAQISAMNKYKASEKYSHDWQKSREYYKLRRRSSDFISHPLVYELPCVPDTSNSNAHFVFSVPKRDFNNGIDLWEYIYTSLGCSYDEQCDQPHHRDGDPMQYLENEEPQVFLELQMYEEELRQELERKDFKFQDHPSVARKCHKYRCAPPRKLRRGSRSSSESDGGRSSSDASDEFDFNGLVDKEVDASDDDEDSSTWHVVARRKEAVYDSIQHSQPPPPTNSKIDQKWKNKNSTAPSRSVTASKPTPIANPAPLSPPAAGPSSLSQTHPSPLSQTHPSPLSNTQKLAPKQDVVEAAASSSGDLSGFQPRTPELRCNLDGQACVLGSPDTSSSSVSPAGPDFPSLAESVTAAKQQQQAAKAASAKTSSPFVRMSQKQRKQRQREEQEASASAAPAAATPAAAVSPKTATPAWGQAQLSAGSPPCCSAQEQQQESQFPSFASGRTRRSSQRTLSGSSGGSDLSVGTPSTSENLSTIMRREKNMRANYVKSQKKSLEHIQMEERAIVELEQHYRSLAGPRDTVTVTRLSSALVAQPQWTERHRPRDLLSSVILNNSNS
ncbi:uncharacterized protein LOC108682849 [Hyalella azteca]|uniref:Uncharacterized protein LOC108682849 n=1 Tax=Hyalella azteca TaxID=294128 RepID=A0A8B7PN14_HYAAZ|nr:uncharacterized protein LOC108682849 [Hyalella azteca]